MNGYWLMVTSKLVCQSMDIEIKIRIFLSDTPVRDWMIQAYLPWFPIDIDKGDTSDEGVLSIVKKFLYHFDELGLREENYKLYFSGRGYHIMIHGDCFGFPESHQDLELVVRLTKEKLLGELDMLDTIDHSIYHRKALIRCPHSLNAKSNLYKNTYYKI